MAARVLPRLASGLGLLVVFAVSAALALLIHVNSPLERRLITAWIPPLLASELKGSFELDSIERIERSGVVFNGFRARDPRGREVVRATTIRVEVNLIELSSALLLGPRRLSIVLEQVQIASAEAWVYDDTGAGIPSIAEAFTPRGPSTGKGRPVRLAIRAIDIERVRGRGSVAGLPVLTAELAKVRGWLRVGEAGVDLSFQRFSTTVDGLPRAQAKGIGSLRVVEPGLAARLVRRYLRRAGVQQPPAKGRRSAQPDAGSAPGQARGATRAPGRLPAGRRDRALGRGGGRTTAPRRQHAARGRAGRDSGFRHGRARGRLARVG